MADQTSAETCASCGKSARERCSGCNSGLDKYGKKADKTVYCDKACQRAHFNTHKANCKQSRVYLRLYRTGEFAKELFFVYRKHTFPGTVTQIKKTENSLQYRLTTRDADSEALPVPIVPVREDREAILASERCVDAMLVCKDIVLLGLDGLYDQIEEVITNVKGQRREVFQSRNPYFEYRHELYRVRFKNGEGFAIDITAAQYGHTVVIPWDDYYSKQVAHMRATFRLGFQEARQTHYLSTLIMSVDRASDVAYDNEITRHSLYPLINRSVCQWLADEKQKSLPNVLQLPESAYRKTFTRYTAFLDQAIASLLKGLEDGGAMGKEKIYGETAQRLIERSKAWHEEAEEGRAASMVEVSRWVGVSLHPDNCQRQWAELESQLSRRK